MADEDRRKLEFHVGEELCGMSIRDLMRKKLHFSARLMSRVKYRDNGILLNGQPVRATEILKKGDELSLDISDPGTSRCVWTRPEHFIPPSILYEDSDLLILDKPSGLVSHPSFGHYTDTLANAAAVCLGYENTSREIHMIGRLDRDTAGCVIVAKNSAAAAALFREQQEGVLRKTYLARVSGAFVLGGGTIDSPIGKVPGVLMLRRIDPAGKSARTMYRVIRVFSGNGDEASSLLAIRLTHGRTHQIRVHMASIGHPLLHDLLYGPGGAYDRFEETGDPAVVRVSNELLPEGETDGANDRTKALCLCAYRLQLIHPFIGKKIRVTASLPAFAGDPESQVKIEQMFENNR